MLLTGGVVALVAGAVLRAQNPDLVVQEVLHLGGGKRVVGAVIKQTEDTVFVDVGFDILKVPVATIVRREPVGLEANQGGDIRREEVFAMGELPEMSITEGAARVSEAVVKIESPGGQGSGFVTSEDGYIVTNFHVVEDEEEVDVTLYLKSKSGFDLRTVRKVKVVAINPEIDLALIKMEPPDGVRLTAVLLGDSEKVRAGDRVFAIGTPIGLERTVSSGIVSVTNRTFGGHTMFQITAAINPGNSGGPLFTLRGQCVGVNSAKMVGVGIEGLNFSIPSKYVIDFLRNREAFAFDATRSKGGVHYLPAPRKPK
jgi:serine protease Do